MEFSSINIRPQSLENLIPSLQGIKRSFPEPVSQSIIASIGESGSNAQSTINLQDRDVSRPKKIARTSKESVDSTENIESSSDCIRNDFLALQEKVRAFCNRDTKLVGEANNADTTIAFAQSLKKSLNDEIKVLQLVEYLCDLAQKEWLSSEITINMCPRIISKVQEAIDLQTVSTDVIKTVFHKYLDLILNKDTLTKNIALVEYIQKIKKSLELCKPFISQGYLLPEDEELFKDFTITFEKEEEAVFPNYIKKILAASSPYFKSMFNHDFAEAQQKNIVIQESKELFVGLLDICNGNFVALEICSWDEQFQFAKLAQKYDIQIILEHVLYSIEELLDEKLAQEPYGKEDFESMGDIYKNICFLQIQMSDDLKSSFSAFFGFYLFSKQSQDSVMETINAFNEHNISMITLPQLSIHYPLNICLKYFTTLKHLIITFADNSHMSFLKEMRGITHLEITVNPNSFDDEGLLCLQGIPLEYLIIKDAKLLTNRAYVVLQDMPLSYLSIGSPSDQLLIDDSILFNLRRAPLKFLQLESRNVMITEIGLALIENAPLETLTLGACHNLTKYSFDQLKFSSLKNGSYWLIQRLPNGLLFPIQKFLKKQDR